MTTWVKKLADWDVRLASQKNISPSVQTWALFSIQQGEEEGPTVAPTNGWAGLLMVADWRLLTNSHLLGGGARCGITTEAERGFYSWCLPGYQCTTSRKVWLQKAAGAKVVPGCSSIVILQPWMERGMQAQGSLSEAAGALGSACRWPHPRQLLMG